MLTLPCLPLGSSAVQFSFSLFLQDNYQFSMFGRVFTVSNFEDSVLVLPQSFQLPLQLGHSHDRYDLPDNKLDVNDVKNTSTSAFPLEER